MGCRRGARDLGLKVTWKYEFVGHGTTLQPRRDTIAIDVGNRCEPGILDQHHDRALAESTSKLVTKFPHFVLDHLLGPWQDRADGGCNVHGREWTPIITTHYTPDFDGVVSALLIQKLIEDGDLPHWASSLADFAAEVDQGRFRLDKKTIESGAIPVSCAMYALSDPNTWQPNEARMLSALELVETEIKHLKEKLGSGRWGPSVFIGEHAGGWSKHGDGPAITERLQEDALTFSNEFQDDQKETIELPSAADGPGWHPRLCEPAPVRAIVRSEAPSSFMYKDWARAENIEYLVVPWPHQHPTDKSKQRVITSLDPKGEYPGRERPPTLQGLGAALEAIEVMKRKEKKTPRSGSPRWLGVTNDDPWYDGRGHDYTMVDTPRDWSVLTRQNILEITKDRDMWRFSTDNKANLHWKAQIVLHTNRKKEDAKHATAPTGVKEAQKARELSRSAKRAQGVLHRAVPQSGLTSETIHGWLTEPPATQATQPAENTSSESSTGDTALATAPAEPVVKRPERVTTRTTSLEPQKHLIELQPNDITCQEYYWPEQADAAIQQIQIAYTGHRLWDFLGALRALLQRKELSGASLLLQAPIDRIPGSDGEDIHLAARIFKRLGFVAEVAELDSHTYITAGHVLQIPPPARTYGPWWDTVATGHTLHYFYQNLAESLLSQAARLHAKDGDHVGQERMAARLNHTLLLFDMTTLSSNPAHQAVYKQLRNGSDVDETTAKLRHEANALQEQINNDEERGINFFLFVIGLMGLVEAVNGIDQLLTGKREYGISFVVLFFMLSIAGARVFRLWPFRR